MPNLVNSKGFYTSKEMQSKAHTLYQNVVENIQNMEHSEIWKNRKTNNNPVKFGVYYRETCNGKKKINKYWMFATNMKRSYEDLSAEFTPYQHDEKSINTVSTHGYGGIALPLKIGGHMYITFTNKDVFSTNNEDYSELSMNIDSFMENAKSNDVSKTLPPPAFEESIPDHKAPICFMESIWGKSLINHFKEENLLTFYVFYNPDLANTCDDTSTAEYLRKEIDETFQNQFLEQINKGYIKFFSSYSNDSINKLPFAFFSPLPNQQSISIKGDGGNLIDEEIFEFTRGSPVTANVLYYKYKDNYGRLEFRGSSNEYETKPSKEVMNDFVTDFTIRTGALSSKIQLYSASMKKRTNLSLEIEKEGVFAEGVFVTVGDIPLTSMPIPHYVEDASHLKHNSCRRTFVDIDPENYKEWKKSSIDATEMKEDTTLSQGSLLSKAIYFVIKTYNGKTKKTIVEMLAAKQITNKKVEQAAHAGNVFEIIEITGLLNGIPNTGIIHGDKNVKKINKLNGQGIDHVISLSPGLDILVQDKLQQRTTKDKIKSYVDSVKEYRDKFPQKCVYSLFINGFDNSIKTHFGLMEELICNNCILKKKEETHDQFFARIKFKIEEIRNMFN